MSRNVLRFKIDIKRQNVHENQCNEKLKNFHFSRNIVWRRMEEEEKGEEAGGRHCVGLRVFRNVCKNFGRKYWRKIKQVGKPSSILVNNIYKWNSYGIF